MSISAAQAANVKGAWEKVVSPKMQDHGTSIFVNFLTAHPDQQAYFKKFKDVPTGSLAGNAEVAKQALAVMKELGKYIQVVDNEGTLKAACKAMAASHKAMNVVAANFGKIIPVIIDYIVAAGGDRAAWTACMDTIGKAITSQQ